MDTLFRLVSLQAASEQQQQQQQSASYNSRSTTSSGSRSSSHQTNASYSYYHHSSNSGGGGGGGGGYYYGGQQPPPSQYYYLEPYQEECGNAPHHQLYMDEAFSSSSSSRHFHHGAPVQQQQPPASSTPTGTAPTPPLSTSSTAAGAGHGLFEAADLSFPPDLNLDFSSPASSSGGGTASSGAVGGGGGGRWASQLLLECARSVAARDSQRVQQLMWMLNELASPYGDVEQKLASYFLQGLFARLTASGQRTLRTLAAASDRNTSFDSTRRTALRFQELSPWSSFGHVAANGAILESFLEVAAAASSETQRFHILDLSNTFCTQWPTLLEALATRSADETPHLSITTVVSAAPSAPTAAVQRVMREIGQRMEKFARLMGVPFRFRAVHHSGDLAELDLDALDLREGGATTALAVNCVNSLRGVVPGRARRRDAFAASLRRLDPRVVTVVEEEADLVASEPDASSATEEGGDTEAAFLKVFGEGLRFFSAYMDSLEESFPKTSNERLALERGAGRAIVDLVSCPASESMERRETAASWARRMRSAGFSPVAFSEDVADDVRSLLRRYREGWSMREAGTDDSAAGAGVFLAWKEQPLVWASAWRP